MCVCVCVCVCVCYVYVCVCVCVCMCKRRKIANLEFFRDRHRPPKLSNTHTHILFKKTQKFNGRVRERERETVPLTSIVLVVNAETQVTESLLLPGGRFTLGTFFSFREISPLKGGGCEFCGKWNIYYQSMYIVRTICCTARFWQRREGYFIDYFRKKILNE